MIKPKFNVNDIKKDLKKRVFEIQRVLVRELIYLGEECVNHARTLNTYQDKTGNLRSSIGYIVMAHREVVGSNFENNSLIKRVKKKHENYSMDPRETALRIAKGLALQYPADSIVLVVVAGMDYAAHVEYKGLDVLTGSFLNLERKLPEMLKKIENKIG